jgi:succinate dehydrogenase / fumarate reductase flavoprotein subunit
VFRTEETLLEALRVIDGLEERYKRISVQDKGKRFNLDLLEAVELGFLLDMAKVMTAAALHRKESRGGHFREDYPTRDDENFMTHSMAYKDPSAVETSGVRLETKPVIFTRYQPMERKY